MHLIISTIEIAAILSLVAFAAMITFRFAGFPDLSVDGVFTLGAVVFAKFYVLGIPIWMCAFLSCLAGACVGFITANISNRLKINPLLASVLILIILYSVNLRILGRPNQALFYLTEILPESKSIMTIFYIIISSICLGVLYLFFRTEKGIALRITGSSPRFLQSIGRNPSMYRAILVSLAGSMVAFSGCLLAIEYKFADVSMGFGMLIIGIAALIIGEKILGRFPFRLQFLAVIVGIVVYEFAVSLALTIGVAPTDVKLATGVITILLLGFGRNKGDLFFADSN